MFRPLLLAILLPLCAAAQTAVPGFKKTWRIHGVDSAQAGDEAAAGAIDGDPMTHWHSRWSGGNPPSHPHEIAVDLGRGVELLGFTYLPRQVKAGGVPNGRIDRYEFLTSGDGTNWTQALRGRFREGADLQSSLFPRPVTARYIKLVSWSAFQSQPWASVAELDILVSDQTAGGLRGGK